MKLFLLLFSSICVIIFIEFSDKIEIIKRILNIRANKERIKTYKIKPMSKSS